MKKNKAKEIMTEEIMIEGVGVKNGPSGSVGVTSSALEQNVLNAASELADAKIARAAEEDKLETEVNDYLRNVNFSDPDAVFEALMKAICHVMPQLVTAKEAGLVEKTHNFDYVSSLNAYMAETQTYFSQSADKSSTGSTKPTETTGLNAGVLYKGNLDMLKVDGGLLGGMDLIAPDVANIMREAAATASELTASTPEANKWPGGGKTSYNLSEGLWAGMNSPKWRMDASDSGSYNNTTYDTASGDHNINYFLTDDDTEGVNKTEASYVGRELAPLVSDAVTQNTILETTLNSYAKQVESEFKFEMDNYNTIVNMNGQMLQAHGKQNKAHSNRLRAL